MAVEDIGLADPRALQMTLSACDAYERLGSPEGELALIQAALYLSCAPKSNAAYMAYKKAQSFIAQDQSRPVPSHLRNAPTQLMRNMGFGRNYRYAHDYPEAYVAGENYFPDDLPGIRFYQPTENGLEAKIKEKVNYLRSLDKKVKKSSEDV
jgi:putative ATPase